MKSYVVPAVIILRFLAAAAFFIAGMLCLNQCYIPNVSAGFIGVAIGIFVNGILIAVCYKCCRDFMPRYESRILLGNGTILGIIFCFIGAFVYLSNVFEGSMLISIGLTAFVDSIIVTLLFIFDRKFKANNSDQY